MIYPTLPSLDLGDKRLSKRCNRLIRQFVAKPSSSIPQACLTWKDTKAAYRFFAHDEIDPEDIGTAHYRQTIARIRKENGIILAPQDTTDLNYTSHKKTKGLGSMGSFERLYGMHVHSCLAVTESSVPLGLLYQRRWVRDPSRYGKAAQNRYKNYMLPIEQKESIRWIKTIEAVEQAVPTDKTVVVIGDRESDIYPLFARPRKQNVHLLVRAVHNRGVVGNQRMLFPTIDAATSCGTIPVDVRKTPQRKQRQATLTVKYTSITLKSPNVGVGRGKGRVDLWCVQAKEEHPPKGEQPVSWTLLTTVPVQSFADAKRIITWYTKRWLIERFHYVLKSGCSIEELQLKEKKRLERALAVYCIVAWQLLWLTYEAREHPDDSCTRIFADDEWQTLLAMTNGKKTKSREPPTLQQAVRMVASLGGFLGRKGDGDPGVKTLWIGLRRLSDMVIMWRYLGGEKKDVGKG